ncbi:MAG: DUF6089 family protein [Mangrovibacterium sp.]
MSLVLLCGKMAYAQPSQATMDLGLWGGLTGYQGDMTYVDRIGSMGNAMGFFMRYNFNPRYAVRVSGMFSGINGVGEFDDLDWEFSKSVSELSAVYEFNFLPYLIGSSSHNISTFLTLGVGASTFPEPTTITGSVINGEYTAPVQDKEGASVGSSMVSAFNIPLGFGFKFNVTKRIGMGSEFVLRKYFNDRLDNLDDPRAYGVEAADGFTSALHNNDWTFHLGVFVCYQIFRADKHCVLYD